MDEGPNDWERQVELVTHEWKAAENPVPSKNSVRHSCCRIRTVFTTDCDWKTSHEQSMPAGDWTDLSRCAHVGNHGTTRFFRCFRPRDGTKRKMCVDQTRSPRRKRDGDHPEVVVRFAASFSTAKCKNSRFAKVGETLVFRGTCFYDFGRFLHLGGKDSPRS